MIKVKRYLNYKKMLNIFINRDGSLGFCLAQELTIGAKKYYAIKIKTNGYGLLTSENIMKIIFPELFAYKPIKNEDGPFWFDRKDKKTRINILNSIINDMPKTFTWYERFYLTLYYKYIHENKRRNT